ncbi:MAG: Zn-ribbon domain-containing OB-fold protein [Candidatus Kariarchaeaceae archaeon]|jgi:uncharacterized OB-fold protein
MKEITQVVKAYEDAINQNRIVGSICDVCHETYVPPRPICINCGSSKIDITTVEGEGKVVTWTVIHIAPPTHIDKVPYILAIVELTNGQKLTGILSLAEGQTPEFDMEVVAGFEEAEEGAKRLRWIPKS